jgi:phosphoribosylanthranilate isomerase
MTAAGAGGAPGVPGAPGAGGAPGVPGAPDVAGPRIKICGVTQSDDAARIVAAGADYLGLNFWPRSKRHVGPERAAAIASAVRAAGAAPAAGATGVVGASLVGLFVNQPAHEIAAIQHAVALDVIQLHGDETPDDVAVIARTTGLPIWKAIAVGSPADLADLDRWPVAALLLDAPTAGRGGAGVTFDWALAAEAHRRYPALRFILAGGLTPANVATAISAVAPWAVDVASGVESTPGLKDPAKVAAFLAAARPPRT